MGCRAVIGLDAAVPAQIVIVMCIYVYRSTDRQSETLPRAFLIVRCAALPFRCRQLIGVTFEHTHTSHSFYYGSMYILSQQDMVTVITLKLWNIVLYNSYGRLIVCVVSHSTFTFSYFLRCASKHTFHVSHSGPLTPPNKCT